MFEHIDLKSIGARIRKLRGSDSRNKFSEGFLVPASSLARWEEGGSQPDLDFLIRLSAGFGVSLAWIITGKDGEPDEDTEPQLGCLKHLDWGEGTTGAQTGDVAGVKQQHSEITCSREIKTGDAANFAEMMALNRELRQALREIADLRVERERMKARIATLEQEVAAHKNGALPFPAALVAPDASERPRANDAENGQPTPQAPGSIAPTARR